MEKILDNLVAKPCSGIQLTRLYDPPIEHTTLQDHLVK